MKEKVRFEVSVVSNIGNRIKAYLFDNKFSDYYILDMPFDAFEAMFKELIKFMERKKYEKNS